MVGAPAACIRADYDGEQVEVPPLRLPRKYPRHEKNSTTTTEPTVECRCARSRAKRYHGSSTLPFLLGFAYERGKRRRFAAATGFSSWPLASEREFISEMPRGHSNAGFARAKSYLDINKSKEKKKKKKIAASNVESRGSSLCLTESIMNVAHFDRVAIPAANRVAIILAASYRPAGRMRLLNDVYELAYGPPYAFLTVLGTRL
ncbi:hypothetical protein PUN28_015109 [Cardiocondyla obscurior]|uniref:Uncharacterized protein n=1 Tax=Cardiocondyla obscurior TaxID=286306 RepID=A0AAW2F1J8_9HYME